MMDEGQGVGEEPGGELGLAIATTFSVAQTSGEFVIKQEPQELAPEMMTPEVMDEHEAHQYCTIDEGLEGQPFPEVSNVIMQRAVSPPTYVDPNETKMEELILYYKRKYQLKDVTVELESCDKIWETLQLIKNISNEEDSCHQFYLPKNLYISPPKLSGPLISYKPILGNSNKALPDFRFSVKSKKKLFHCITCGKEFVDSLHLRQHAINEHGVYVNPKRVYSKPRSDLPKTVPVNADVKNKFIKEIDTENIIPIALPAVHPVKTAQLVQVSDVEKHESPLINCDSKMSDSNKLIINVKEKIKCVLCKRICTDIVYHMRGYHKVGCVRSIIAQCEKIVPDNNVYVEESKKNDSFFDVSEIDINETLAVAVKKRKRNTPRWTVQKKKYKTTDTSKKSNGNGPFKCSVCLGYYKSVKSFAFHRRLHRKRGETPENFDPSKCRFFNSPFHVNKTNNSEDVASNYKSVKKEPFKLQSTLKNYITVEKDSDKADIQNEHLTFPEGMDVDVNNGSNSEQTTCECGRSFRNYHTLYLHKVKCKGSDLKNIDKLHSQNVNDTDSGIGISIKIKKNKNDSYEVVPRSTPIEDTFKDSRSSKDSDASSNDSGMVSIDYNSQKVDSSELGKYSKSHSVLRIQVAEDDEEVDIEDDDSDHSNLNEDSDLTMTIGPLHNGSETVTSDLAENKTDEQNNTIHVMKSDKKSNIVPSLIHLCKQALAKIKQEEEKMSAYKCQTCSMKFKDKTELIEHALSMKHNVNSHCPCGKKFKNLKYFNIHVRRYHPLLLKCSYCTTDFDRVEKFIEHNCPITEGKSFIEPIIQTQCMKCKMLLDLGEQFDKHMKTHNAEAFNYYQCFKCELKFDNLHQRRSHFSKEHGFSLCRICGKLMHIDYLLKHEAYHDGLGYPCHLCKKAFTQKTLLKKHIQGTHDPLVNEIVKCIVCSKSMKLRYLKKHMSFHLHTEICRKCNKCYRTDEHKNLEYHVALDHPNDYPTLKCDTCSMSFLSDKRYEEHCQEGYCNSKTSDMSNLIQNTTSN